ncbi:transcriptional antiterminator [Erysipelotrichaceae bacterium]|nr:transcriptional antiterminator [Erysipelotrichaceae bacterium]
MDVTRRQLEIIKYLKRKDEVSLQSIATEFTISTRTIRNELVQIRQILATYDAVLIFEKGSGYRCLFKVEIQYFSFIDTIELQLEQVILRKNQLVEFLLFAICPQTIDSLCEHFFVSRGTLNNDLVRLKNELKQYHLDITRHANDGIVIGGSEKAIRFYLGEKSNKQVNLELKSIIENQIICFSDKLDNPFTDEGISQLLSYIGIAIERIRCGFMIGDIPIFTIKPEISNLVEQITTGILKSIGLEFPPHECVYLGLQFQSKLDAASYFDAITISQSAEWKEAVAMISYIEQNYMYNLAADKYLIQDLVYHLYSMHFRMMNQLRLKNPMTPHIKKNYPLAVEMTIAAVASIKLFKKNAIDEDEVSYLALHIGAALERCYGIVDIIKTQVILVCSGGAGVGRIMEAKLATQLQFDVKLVCSKRAYEAMEMVYCDVIIATIPVTLKNKPVVYAEMLPGDWDLAKISEGVAKLKKSASFERIQHFFPEELFVISKAKTKKELLSELLVNLEGYNFVLPTYAASVFEREQLASTYLGEHIAIPHAMIHLAKDSKIAVAILENSIVWDGKHKVEIVFLLALSKLDYSEVMHVYDYIVACTKPHVSKMVKDCTSYRDFLEILKGLQL